MFESKSQKKEKDYQYLAEIFKKSGMDTTEKVEKHLKKVIHQAFLLTIIILFVTGIFCVILPKYSSILGVTGLMCFAWVWQSAITTKRAMHRYIKEYGDS